MAALRERDSAMVQLVLAREKASVAAVKMEISVFGVVEGDKEEEGDLRVGSLRLEGEEGIELGSWVEVMGAGSAYSCSLGEGGGVGGAFGSWDGWERSGSRVAGFTSFAALMRFCRPLRLGMR